jgi:hypothetical protein
MAVPTTNVGLSSIQTEFGGTNPISISEYYAGVLMFLQELQALKVLYLPQDKYLWEYLEEL